MLLLLKRSKRSCSYEGEGSLMAFGCTSLFNKLLELPFASNQKRICGASRLRALLFGGWATEWSWPFRPPPDPRPHPINMSGNPLWSVIWLQLLSATSLMLVNNHSHTHTIIKTRCYAICFPLCQNHVFPQATTHLTGEAYTTAKPQPSLTTGIIWVTHLCRLPDLETISASSLSSMRQLLATFKSSCLWVTCVISLPRSVYTDADEDLQNLCRCPGRGTSLTPSAELSEQLGL